jgi:aryl-alcohol dehydrogenase-like predicted oxidoreductase
MKNVILGSTTIEASRVGLGCGGHSRLGIAKFGVAHAAQVVRKAYDLGINFFDTASLYGTEEAVGLGLKGLDRASYFLSSKFSYDDFSTGAFKTPSELILTVENTLRKLNTDYVDVMHFHGVLPKDYERLIDTLYPTMEDLQSQGKIRYLAISERFITDTSHQMLEVAIPQKLFDVVMVGYNLLNQSADRLVLDLAETYGTGVLCMFAVRNALSNPERLNELLHICANYNEFDEVYLDNADLFDFLGDISLIEAAYRFVAGNNSIHVALTGTSSLDHLEKNIGYILKGPLPEEIQTKLQELFGKIDVVSGD